MRSLATPSEEGWIHTFIERRAFWIHNSDPQAPHAILTSGKHSPGFFNSELVMEDPALLDVATYCLAEKLLKQPKFTAVDCASGPAMGAITVGHDVARHLSQLQGKPCLRVYAEKSEKDGRSVMVFNRTRPRPGSHVLMVEDVITTGTSVKSMSDAIVQEKAIVLPFILALVNRSGCEYVGGRTVISLINRNLPIWDPEDCLLCKGGSEALRPKGDNWSRLQNGR